MDTREAVSERAGYEGERLEVDSAVLSRLIEEVRNGATGAPTAYNRMHNRHNR
ncbi:YhhA family cyclophane-containing RiPP [Sphingomonas folli]|uniref:YhhA family cyclophane-containing RiPP n=1 Tax=Sphingomonas folli TaxID=2862497 RepID=UPI00358DB877